MKKKQNSHPHTLTYYRQYSSFSDPHVSSHSPSLHFLHLPLNPIRSPMTLQFSCHTEFMKWTKVHSSSAKHYNIRQNTVKLTFCLKELNYKEIAVLRETTYQNTQLLWPACLCQCCHLVERNLSTSTAANAIIQYWTHLIDPSEVKIVRWMKHADIL